MPIILSYILLYYIILLRFLIIWGNKFYRIKYFTYMLHNIILSYYETTAALVAWQIKQAFRFLYYQVTKCYHTHKVIFFIYSTLTYFKAPACDFFVRNVSLSKEIFGKSKVIKGLKFFDSLIFLA